MKKIANPDFNLRNKICDIYHQSSHCLRKLRNHTNHHQCDHANHQYDREKQTDRSCQFFHCLIFFFYIFKNFLFQKTHWHIDHKHNRSAKYKRKYNLPYCFQHIKHHIKLPQGNNKKCRKHNKLPYFFNR